MIQISEKDGKVVATITGDTPIHGFTFSLTWDPGRVHIAKMLAKNLRDHLDRKVRQIKIQTYDTGYRAGQSKKRKQTYFTARLAADV